MVFLLPASPVHAATPTATLSTASGNLKTVVTSAKVGENVVLTGTGFAPDAAIAITSTVGTATVQWLSGSGSCATIANGGVSGLTPALDSLVSSGCLTTTADGDFEVGVAVPQMPGGAQSITITDGTNTATVSFTVAASVTVSYAGNNYGFPTETITPSITVNGFGPTETVTITTSMWTTASYTCTTNTMGTCPAGGSNVQVIEQNSGTKTITATGATSGLTASTTYTVNPWAAFYDSQGGATTFSFYGSAPTSVLIEAHGLPAGTIASGSITIGGVATAHPAITVGSSGSIGTITHVVVSPTAQVPFGPVSVVIDGVTFNYASGNIASTGVSNANNVNYWGGVLISSISTSNNVGTGVVTTDAASYKPGTTGFTASKTSPAPAQDQIGIFGYGFVSTGTVTITPATNLGLSTVPGIAVSSSGAFFETETLTDTPWSSSVTPTTAASYELAVSESSANAPANILSPSIGITPWIATPGTTSVNFASTETISVHGFGTNEAVTVKLGGSALNTITAACTSTGATGTCSVSGTVPDLAGGAQAATATGTDSGASATLAGAVTYLAVASFGSSGNYFPTILPNSGSAGTISVLRTGTTYGVHGLAPNTAYRVVWNAISGSVTLGTFTSTATGGIPVPGVQFTVPSDNSGTHIIDIQTANGASALFNGTTSGDVTPQESPFPHNTLTTAFGDMLFSNTAQLTASPSVASIGTPESISGAGLAAGTQYVVTLSYGGSCPTSFDTNQVSMPALGTFTATAGGAVPSTTSVTLTDTATQTETGTTENFVIQTAANFGVLNAAPSACAPFVLAASASDNTTAALAGHSVALTAHGLNGQGATYNVVFNFAENLLGNGYTGTTVGVLAPSSTGAGSLTWTVPAGTPAGTYAVQLVVAHAGTGGLAASTAVLNVPLSIVVGSVNITSCNTISCFTSSTPTTTQVGPNSAIQTTFTDNSNGPVTAIVFAVVHNALGQTVSYSTATVTASASGTSTAYNVLYGLAPGTYSVTIFATSTSGIAISNTSTVSVTIS